MNKELSLKLFELQKRLKPIVKDAPSYFKGRKYFDVNTLLAEVKPHLNELKLVLLQPLSYVDGKAAICTRVIDSETGEETLDYTILPESSDAQKAGAVITYYRRYALTSLLAIEGEEDDDSAGTDNKAPVKPPEKSSYEIALLAIEKLNPNPLSSTRDIMDMAKRINDSLTLTPGQKAELLKKLQTQ